ncbi:hypothetical protein AAG747_05735 [Rapidithrix thailandica]|uniref:Uncharacterized protein n=1 Tax=Rapidithrix thailandica TaxID=413964 RepID=A0AAW9S2U2_9BACT
MADELGMLSPDKAEPVENLKTVEWSQGILELTHFLMEMEEL